MLFQSEKKHLTLEEKIEMFEKLSDNEKQNIWLNKLWNIKKLKVRGNILEVLTFGNDHLLKKYKRMN